MHECGYPLPELLMLNRSPRMSGIVVLAALVAGACVDSENEPVAAHAQAVIGGEPATACGWPSTVRVDAASSCTGTLIHRRIVTTAAHCLRGEGSSARITFGPGRSGAGSFSLTGTCHAGASGQRGVNSRNDWGYCVLPEDDRMDAVPVTTPLVGCEAERFLKAGARAWVVGFGETRNSGGINGAKNQVEVMVNQLDKLGPGTIDVGDATAGACHGDSGGPIYMQLRDGANDFGFRVFGSTSGPGTRVGCDCTCSTTYVNIANHVAAIEEREGIDVTPCTDDDGEWDPGPGCNDQLADPEHGTGTWPTCQVTRTRTPISSCGPAFVPDAGSDPGPVAGTGGSTAGSGAAGAAGAAGTAGATGAGTGGAGTGAAGTTAGTGVAGSGGTLAPTAGAPAAPGPAVPSAGSPAVPPTAPPVAGQPGFGMPDALAPQPPPAGSFAPPPATGSASADPSGCGCSAVGGRAGSRWRARFALLVLGLVVPRLARRRGRVG